MRFRALAHRLHKIGQHSLLTCQHIHFYSHARNNRLVWAEIDLLGPDSDFVKRLITGIDQRIGPNLLDDPLESSVNHKIISGEFHIGRLPRR